MNKLTNEEFEERLLKKGVKVKPLDDYINNKTPIRFLCEKHGEFYARPDCVLNGQGCPKCGGTKKLTAKEFVEEANFVHNNFFTYDETTFLNSSSKVKITCPIHGEFWQKANNHLNGQGCLKCKLEHVKHEITLREKVNKSTKKLNTQSFVEKAKDVHGDKYDYSQIEYKDSRTKVKVICKEHGEFFVTPNHLLSGRGCPLCSKNKKMTTEEFIKKAKEVHGDTYDYSKTKYVRTHEDVIITCKKHGDFKQTPSNHLTKQGCPICQESYLENEIRQFLLSNQIDFYEQHRFPWLGKLSLDFFLPKYNIGIECQGIQHFEPVGHFGGEEVFKKQIERDIIKYEMCIDNGIKILYYTNLKLPYQHTLYNNTQELLKEIKNG